VSQEDFSVVRRAALDSIPAMRRLLLDSVLAGNRGDAADLGLPHSTWIYLAQDLRRLGLLEQGRDSEAESRIGSFWTRQKSYCATPVSASRGDSS